MVFGKQVVQPNQLSTAVAFQVLDEVTCVFGRFRPVLELITEVLKKSVYAQKPVLPHTPIDPDDEYQVRKHQDDVLQAYYDAEAFFVTLARKEDQLVSMGGVMESLQKQFEELVDAESTNSSSRYVCRHTSSKGRTSPGHTHAQNSTVSATVE